MEDQESQGRLLYHVVAGIIIGMITGSLYMSRVPV